MIDIRTLDGHDINMNENAIVLIAGAYPHDVGPTRTSMAFPKACWLQPRSLIFSWPGSVSIRVSPS
jgi:hypothetical protein